MMLWLVLVGMVFGGAALGVAVWGVVLVRVLVGRVRDMQWYRAELVCGGRAGRRLGQNRVEG